MRKFDPWSVFFRREFNRKWPFLAGFAITGAIIAKMTAGLTEEDAKNSKFVQEHNRLGILIVIFLFFVLEILNASEIIMTEQSM